MMRTPDNIDLSIIEEVKAKNAWQRAASRVLTICWKAKGGFYFHEPVDPSKFGGIEDYFEIITSPMDFGTIRKKLEHNVYNNIDEFINDMYLVFSNCAKYNGPENTVTKYSIDIKNLFEENLKQTGFMK